MLGLVIVFLLLREILKTNDAIDIHLYDTYFIFESKYISLLFFLYILFVYACYNILRKRTETIPKIIIVIQITGLFLVVINSLFQFKYSGLTGMPRRYYDYSAWESFKTFASMNKLIVFSAFYFILSQLFFFLYFVLVFVRRFFKKV